MIDYILKSNNSCSSEKSVPESINSENTVTSSIHNKLEATVESLKVCKNNKKEKKILY